MRRPTLRILNVNVPLVCAVAFLMAGGSLVDSVSAQTLRGRVLDSATGDFVPLAYIGLLAEGGDMVVASLAGTEGHFEVTAPETGSYFLYVSRTGYETLVEGLFELGADGMVDLQVGLTPAPIALDPLLVETENRDVNPLEANGFYDRAIMGLGTLMIREEIQRRSIDKVSDAFRVVPRLSIDESRPMTGSPDVMANPAVWNYRGSRKCSPTLYIDRHVVFAGGDGPLRPDDYMAPAEVEAIEIYTRSSEVPVGFEELSQCGVILVWTRLR